MLTMGAIAFLLFYLSDYLQLHRRDRAGLRCFFVGMVVLALSTGELIRQGVLQCSRHPAVMVCALILAAANLLLLVYTLFFALPKAAYQGSKGKKALVTTGVYALCRHPGIVWFAMMYLFLWLALGGKLLLTAFLLFSSLNYFYAYMQDGWVFPKQFDEYKKYQQETPFIIPTKESFRACVATLDRRSI